MVRFLESFDHYSTADLSRKWTDSGGFYPTVVPGAGSCNSQACKITVFNAFTKGIAFGSNVVTVGHAVKINSFLGHVNPTPLLTIGDGFADCLNIGRATDGSIYLNRVNSGVSQTTLGLTGPDLVRDLTYYYLELATEIDNAGGAEIRINGIPVLSFSGDTLGAGMSSSIPTRVTFYGNDNEARYIDDLYCLDDTGGVNTTFLGPIRVQAHRPTGVGTHQDWALVGAGSHWQAVDDNVTPDLDVSYVTTATPGALDTQEFADTGLPAPGTVFAVQVSLLCRKTDSGYRGIKPLIRMGGTNYLGTEQGLSTEYSYKHEVWNTNPAGGGWNIAAVNAMQAGIELSS